MLHIFHFMLHDCQLTSPLPDLSMVYLVLVLIIPVSGDSLPPLALSWKSNIYVPPRERYALIDHYRDPPAGIVIFTYSGSRTVQSKITILQR